MVEHVEPYESDSRFESPSAADDSSEGWVPQEGSAVGERHVAENLVVFS
jgi:hypothetical protein